MAGFKAGWLRHRVTIQDPLESQDATSGAVEFVGWSDTFPNVPADVDFLSGKEYLAAAQIQSEEVAEITIRWRPGLHAKQRVVWSTDAGTRVFNISAPIPEGRGAREFVTLRCSEGVNAGA